MNTITLTAAERASVQPDGCSIEGCDKPKAYRSMCSMHYAQWLRSRSLPPCSVDGCERMSGTRGMCPAHYARTLITGSAGAADIKTAFGTTKVTLGRLAARQTNECVEWPHHRDRKGYGVADIGNGPQGAHALICEMAHGPRPVGMECRHLCGNAGRVNHRHLRWGTHVENCADMVDHGTALRGTRHPLAKLNEDAVRAIRQANGVSRPELARRYGVAVSTITHVVRGTSWGWLQ